MTKGGWKILRCLGAAVNAEPAEKSGSLCGREESTPLDLHFHPFSLCCFSSQVCALSPSVGYSWLSHWGLPLSDLALDKWAGSPSLVLAKPGRNLVCVTASTSALLCTWKFSRTWKIEQGKWHVMLWAIIRVMYWYTGVRESWGDRNPWQKLVFICPVLCCEKSSLAAKLDPVQRLFKWASSLLVLAEKTTEVLSVSAVQQEQRQIKIAFASSGSLSGEGQQ